MRPVEVNIEKDKINDFKYIQEKVLGVCLQTLHELSKNTEESFDDLAKKFLPVENDQKEDIIKNFLSTIEVETPVIGAIADKVVCIETKSPIKKKRKITRKKKLKKSC